MPWDDPGDSSFLQPRRQQSAVRNSDGRDGKGPSDETRTFNALNQPKEVWYPDDQTPYQRTHAEFFYDERALPQRTLWQSGALTLELGLMTRNLSGLPLIRASSDGAWQAVWQYDPMGRVEKFNVEDLAGGPVTRARQGLSYTPFDDVQELVHDVDSSTHDFVYSYDKRAT